MGTVQLPGSLQLQGSLALEPGSFVTGDSATISLAGSAGILIGGALSVGTTASVYGDAQVGGGLAVSSDVNVGGVLRLSHGAIVSGDVAAGGKGSFGSDVSSGGDVSILGAVRTMSDVVFSGGTLSVSPTGGVVGAPMLLRSATEIEPRDATALSIVGGDAQDGSGGTVYLQGGRKGGDHFAGAVVIGDCFGVEHVRVDENGIALSAGGGGTVSLAPAVLASGLLSVTGATSLLSDAFVGHNFVVAGDASVLGATTGTDFVQAGVAGSISYQGTLAGSGWLDPNMLRVCDATQWSLGGSCSDLFSETPGQAGTHVILYFNFDTVAHALLYGADSQVWMTIQPGATFPVYVNSARRRRMADVLIKDAAHARRVAAERGE